MSKKSDQRDSEYLESLGYEQKFERSMSLWSNLALGFLYLSPLVSVVAMLAQGLALDVLDRHCRRGSTSGCSGFR